MYNRYVPQPDGSFRKNTFKDLPPQRHRQPQPKPCPLPNDDRCEEPRRQPSRPAPDRTVQNSGSIGSFIRQLLPGGLDMGDLLVILLVLLMTGDCQENNQHAMLTLLLYLIM